MKSLIADFVQLYNAAAKFLFLEKPLGTWLHLILGFS